MVYGEEGNDMAFEHFFTDQEASSLERKASKVQRFQAGGETYRSSIILVERNACQYSYCRM